MARGKFDIADFVFTFDFKSAYHHISIFAEQKQYLGYSWNINIRKYYLLNVLPFALSSVGYIFFKSFQAFCLVHEVQ